MLILILKRHKEAFISIWGQMNSFSLDSSSLDELSNRDPPTGPGTDQRFFKANRSGLWLPALKLISQLFLGHLLKDGWTSKDLIPHSLFRYCYFQPSKLKLVFGTQFWSGYHKTRLLIISRDFKLSLPVDSVLYSILGHHWRWK